MDPVLSIRSFEKSFYLIFMPKLLQINVALNKGSTGRIAEQIGKLARSKGWDTFILHGARYVNTSEMYSFQTGTPLLEKIHAVRSMLFDAHGLGSVNETQKAIEIIKQIKPDIIHLHNIHGYYLNYKILFEYLATTNTPVVWTLHDCWSMTGHCSHFDYIGCERWKYGCYNCPLKGDYPKSLFLDRSKQNYLLKKTLFSSVENMTIVPVSKWLGSIVEQSFLREYPIRVINNGVDLKVFSPKETDLKDRLGLTGKNVLLGVAASWKEDKGLREFIKLSRIAEYQVIMVGVPAKLKGKLPEAIIAIERTNSQEELADYYSMADVLVNPTYNDTFPTVNLEALACGTPVVTYRTGGSPESITPETGFVVEKGDCNALYAAIMEIIAKGKDFYSAACRKRAENLYNKDDRFLEYLDLYQHLLSDKCY